MREIAHLSSAFATVLKELRRERRVSQEKLSERAGVSRSFVSFLETGDQQPGLNTVLILAEALGLSGAELIARVEKQVQLLTKA